MIVRDNKKAFTIGMSKAATLEYAQPGTIAGGMLPDSVNKEELYSLIIGLAFNGAIKPNYEIPVPELTLLDLANYYFISTVGG